MAVRSLANIGREYERIWYWKAGDIKRETGSSISKFVSQFAESGGSCKYKILMLAISQGARETSLIYILPTRNYAGRSRSEVPFQIHI